MRCVASIQAQSMFYMPNSIAARIGIKAALAPDEIDTLADHITDFSLAGIRAAAAAEHRHRPDEGRRPSVPVRAGVRSAVARRR
jgi:hypothetical protein